MKNILNFIILISVGTLASYGCSSGGSSGGNSNPPQETPQLSSSPLRGDYTGTYNSGLYGILDTTATLSKKDGQIQLNMTFNKTSQPWAQNGSITGTILLNNSSSCFTGTETILNSTNTVKMINCKYQKGSFSGDIVYSSATSSTIKQSTMLLTSSTSDTGGAVNLSLTLPCGPDSLLSVIAESSGYSDAATFFYQKLFSATDGQCKASPQAQGALVDCTQPMYTYNGMVTTAEAYFPTFACTGSIEDRVRDISGFFANIAQETYGGLESGVYDNTGGLYMRIENEGIPNPAYDPSMYYIDQAQDTSKYCQPASPSYGEYTWSTTPENYFYLQNWNTVGVNCPANYTQVMTVALGSGNWTGRGAIQLTGDSIFYGTQLYNSMSNQSLTISQFANDLLNNDGVTWFSALAYWTMPKPNQPTESAAQYYLVNPNDPDFGFGQSVYKINGGCNNYNPGRLSFFLFFESQLTANFPEAKDTESAGALSCP